MTATNKKPCDVFISHAASDNEIARDIARNLESAGLETFYTGLLEPGADISEAIWEALAESRALIMIVSPNLTRHAIGMIELGAASAWNKPIFLLLNGPSSTRLAAPLDAYTAYPLSRLDEVIRAIHSGFDPLSDDDRGALANIYRRLSIPADQLSMSPKVLRALTTQFNRITHKQLSGERLLSEILRMRKKGELPRLRPLPPKVKTSPVLKRKKPHPPRLRPRKSVSP
jgi:hypothetical protein